MLALAAIALAAYVGLLAALGRSPYPSERPVLRLCLLTAYAGILVAPLVQRRVSRSVRRAVEGDRETAEEMLRQLGGRLSRALPWEESLLRLAESLRESLRLSAVEIYTGSHRHLERQVGLPRRGPAEITVTPAQLSVLVRGGVRSGTWASVWLPEVVAGREHGELRVAPLCASGELVGLIVAERNDATDPFRDEDDEILAELVAQVSLATRNVDLDTALRASLAELRQRAEDLRLSRARVVAAADAERRRIERDLHDGAQQSLIALSMSARTVRQLVDSRDPAATECLDELVREIRRTAEELRELAHGIYPPLLLDSGVGVALQFAAPRCCPGAVVEVTRARYPAPVEAAVYFCCLEAMQNSAKYAPDSTIRVRVREEDSTLLFEVSDDGPGFDTARTSPGQGLTNMADRVGAIGGSVQVSSVPGRGTAVRGNVPLGQPAS
jgi:signal transduction histidine kinase